MSPEMIVMTIQSVACAVDSVFQFLCTEQGQALVKQSIEDTRTTRETVQKFATWIENLVKGQL